MWVLWSGPCGEGTTRVTHPEAHLKMNGLASGVGPTTGVNQIGREIVGAGLSNIRVL